MHTCETCQTLMLEYLYDLLDESERQPLQDHLAGCAPCQGALQRARQQQQLLAAAARSEFPAVVFQPPVAQPIPEASPAPAAPAVLPMPAGRAALRPAATDRRWRRWAVAAAVLLGIGLAIPGIWVGGNYLSASRKASAGAAVIAELRSEMRDAAKKMNAVPREREAQLSQAMASIRDQEVKVEVTGPRTVIAGAPAEFRLHTTNANGVAAAAKISARVIDDQGKTASLPVEKLDEGDYRLVLPASLAARPYSQMALLVSANRKEGLSSELNQPLSVAQPVYVTHLATDKPMYQPGDIVHFRSLTLDRSTHRPAQDALNFLYTYTTPTGAVHTIQQGGNSLRQNDPWNGPEVKGPDGQPLRGVGAGMFLLGPEAPGGEYKLTVRELQNRFPPQERKFVVNAYQKPRLNKTLDFNRKTYGPRDEVQALCKALRADGGPVREKDVQVTVTIDGKTYDARGEVSGNPIGFKTDADGQVTVRFRLPEKIDKGQASVAVKFNDGANVEAIVRPIPIVLKAMQVDFFPEGGDLIAGLPNRVYFTARTMLDRPADLKGVLLEDGKPLPLSVATLTDDREPGVNQGMGRFEFTPVAGRAYQLRIESPTGIDKPVALPVPREDGVVLRVDDGVITARQTLKVQVRSTKPRNLLVSVSCRDQHVGSANLKENQTEAAIKLLERVGGVCKVTVYERGQNGANLGELRPVAERLIYRQSSDYLHVVIRPEEASYVPREQVKLHLQTLTEDEEPAPAVMMIAVVDKSVLTLADEKTARTLPTHFLLTSDVKKTEELEYADFLLGPHPKASQALDLLLGTHGWRRFAQGAGAAGPELQNQSRPAVATAGSQPMPVRPGTGAPGMPQPAQPPQLADQLVATAGVPGPAVFQAMQEAAQKVQQQSHEQATALKTRYDEAGAALARQSQDASYVAAVDRLGAFQRAFEQVRRTAVPVLAALLVLFVTAAVIINLKALKRALPCYAVAGVCAAILVVLVVGGPASEPSGDGESTQVAKLKIPSLEEKTKSETTATETRPTDDKDDVSPAVEEKTNAAKQFQNGPDVLPHANLDLPNARRPVPTAKPGIAPTAMPPMAPGNFTGMPKVGADKKADKAEFPRDNRDDMRKLAEKEAPLVGDQGGGGKGDGKEGKFGEARGELAAKKRIDGLQVAGKDRAKDLDLAQPNLRFRRQLEQQFEKGKKARGGPVGYASMPVREYAHQRLPGSAENRSDFTETLYWHPALVLPNGKTVIAFDLCDSVTSFEVVAFAHGMDGRLGASTYVFDSRLPFTLQPKAPLEVTASDKIAIPLSVSNNTNDRQIIGVMLTQHQGLTSLDSVTAGSVHVEAEAAARKVFHFQPSIKEGQASLTFGGKAEGFAPDLIRTAFRVVPEGFPIVGQQSDMLEGSALVKVPLPQTWIKGTLKLQAQVFPSTLADLQKGLEHLLREPNGCFEQTSTSNYPNLLILDYLRESDQSKPEIERRARDLLARGYQKLISFECLNSGKNKREGYEWFGGTAPAHEALTAYGLMQFRDLARVQDVDAQMIQRTHQYLLSQRDGKGGFVRNQRALDTFGRAPEPITNAYIVWALTETGGEDDLAAELKALTEQAATSKDPYFLSLVGNTLLNRGKTAEALAILKKVVTLQDEDGHLMGETTSITGSGDRNLQIETTALAVLAWLKANNPAEFKKPLDKAIAWIGKQRGGYGGFGSTQSTILALKAVIAYTRANKKTAEAGELTLLIDDKPVLSKKYPAGVAETLTLDLADAEKLLKPGLNKVRVEITGKSAFPYTLSWSYRSLQPASAEKCAVRLSTNLARSAAAEGDTVRLSVKIENQSDKGQGMATAIIGLPGGMTIPEDLKQLKEYIRVPDDGKRPTLSAFEIRGRELVLYWRDLAPKETIEVPVDLICRVPGEYSGPASRAYLYYNDDHKHWVEPLKIAIAAAK